MLKILEPETGLVHFDAPALLGNATLCGLTDFIGYEAGQSTRRRVTCLGCKAVVEHVVSRRSNNKEIPF